MKAIRIIVGSVVGAVLFVGVVWGIGVLLFPNTAYEIAFLCIYVAFVVGAVGGGILGKRLGRKPNEVQTSEEMD